MDWPSELPCFLLDGYAAEPESAVLQTDFGLIIRRRQILSEELEGIPVALYLTDAQEPIFRVFFERALEKGTLPFNAPILANGTLATREVTFDGAEPDYTPATPTFVRVTARLISSDTFSTP